MSSSAIVIARAPLRVSFLGGGSALPIYLQSGGEGRVLSATIDKDVHVIVKRLQERKVVAHYTAIEIVSRASELKNNYIRATLEAVGIETGIEIVSMSDISMLHSGLGGSSAFLVALIAALEALEEPDIYGGFSLAQTAFRIETDILGKRIGAQDHYAAAYGGFNEFIFSRGETVFVKRLTMPPDIESKFLLIRIGRELQEPQTSDAIFEEIGNPSNSRRSLALCESLAKLAERGKRYIDRGDYDRAFGLMNDAWIAKRGLATAVSNKLIDTIYDEVIAAGAMAGKLCGAGGEGHMLFWCPKGRESVIERLQGSCLDATIVPFNFSLGGVETRVAFQGEGWNANG